MTGPYSGGYFSNVFRFAIAILVLLFVYSVIQGIFSPVKHEDPIHDSKYHEYRMLFNKSSGKQVFKD